MTPFGAHLRALRTQRKIRLSTMAAGLHVSAAYLSALEHGRRGRPAPGLVQQICGYFGLVWDDVEYLKSLAEISRPKVTLDTSGLSAAATALANELAREIRTLPEEAAEDLRRRLSGWRGKGK